MYKGSLTNTDSIPPLHMYYKQRQNEWYFRKNTWKQTHIHWTDFNLYNASHLGVRHLNITEVASTVSAIQISYKRFTKNKTKQNQTKHTHSYTHTTTPKLLTTFRTFFSSKVNLIDLRWKHKSYGSSVHHIWCILCTPCTSDCYAYISGTTAKVWSCLDKYKIHKLWKVDFNFSKTFKALETAHHFPQTFTDLQRLCEPWSSTEPNF